MLRDDVLISCLHQLRSGYPDRPQEFPQSLALIWVRDVRDYKVTAGGSNRLNTASPFNIKMDLCLRYGDVTLGIELKVWREGRPDPMAAGLEQLDRYLAGLGLDSGWLIIFDHLPTSPTSPPSPSPHLPNQSRRLPNRGRFGFGTGDSS